VSWAVEFLVRLQQPPRPARLFRDLAALLSRTPTFGPLSTFQVIEGDYTSAPLIDLDDAIVGFPPPNAATVAAALARYSEAEDVAFKGAWRTTTAVGPGESVVRGAVTVTVPGASFHWPTLPVRPLHIVWSVGDWRRYAPYVGDSAEKRTSARAGVDAVIRDLAIVVELGAESIWAIDDHRVLHPEHVFAVYHRHPSHYRLDVPVGKPSTEPIDVYGALGTVDDISSIETGAGPIVYHPELGGGDLFPFYAALGVI
jgi:hypothetical protein